MISLPTAITRQFRTRPHKVIQISLHHARLAYTDFGTVARQKCGMKYIGFKPVFQHFLGSDRIGSDRIGEERRGEERRGKCKLKLVFPFSLLFPFPVSIHG